jgi:hypothetical protein
MQKICISLFLCIFLLGCSSQPLKIDIPATTFSSSKLSSSKPKLQSIEIINKAKEGKLKNSPLGSDSIFPIKTSPTTQVIVENDIRNYFRINTEIGNKNNINLRVVIHKADSYWVWGGSSKIPIFGLLTVASNTEFGINLKLSFEVIVDGKVARTYWYDEVITIQAPATTEESLKSSFKHLIDEYRATLFSELHKEFIQRYI